MKYLKFFETKFRAPGLINAHVGEFLFDKFFSNISLHEYIYDVVETENPDSNNEVIYLVSFKFYSINVGLFENIINMTKYLINNFNLDSNNRFNPENIYINSDYKNTYAILNIEFIGFDNVEKIRKMSSEHYKFQSNIKKYNL